jgi:hypothetical protein
MLPEETPEEEEEERRRRRKQNVLSLVKSYSKSKRTIFIDVL